MDKKQAIEAIRNNWPDSRYSMLREALDIAIAAIEESMGKLNKQSPGVGKYLKYHKEKVTGGDLPNVYDWTCSGCGRHFNWTVSDCPYCRHQTTITTGGTQPTDTQQTHTLKKKSVLTVKRRSYSMEFEIGDLVDVDELIYVVKGVDDERLFVSPFHGGPEREVPFSEVNNVWRNYLWRKSELW